MLGKFLAKGRTQIYDNLVATVATKKTYDITESYKDTGAGLPTASANPYKKRPMKLVYDKNEYHSFRLPSEQHFLLGSYDQEDLFGKRKGIDHSPHIRAQLNLDSNLVWFWFLMTMVALGTEMKYHDEFLALRDNLVKHDMGKFEYNDFK